MAIEDRVKALLEKYKNVQGEYDYFDAILNLMIRIDTPITEAYGYAWMNVLHWTIIYTSTLVIGDPKSNLGWFDDLSEAIVVVFAEINDDPSFWKVGRTAFADDNALISAEKDILFRLRTDNTITKIETYLHTKEK